MTKFSVRVVTGIPFHLKFDQDLGFWCISKGLGSISAKGFLTTRFSTMISLSHSSWFLRFSKAQLWDSLKQHRFSDQGDLKVLLYLIGVLLTKLLPPPGIFSSHIFLIYITVSFPNLSIAEISLFLFFFFLQKIGSNITNWTTSAFCPVLQRPKKKEPVWKQRVEQHREENRYKSLKIILYYMKIILNFRIDLTKRDSFSHYADKKAKAHKSKWECG